LNRTCFRFHRHRYTDGSELRTLPSHPIVFEVVLQHLLSADAKRLACAFGAPGIAFEEVAGRAAAGAELTTTPVAVGAVAEPAKLLTAVLARDLIQRTTLHRCRGVVDGRDGGLDVVRHVLVRAQRVQRLTHDAKGSHARKDKVESKSFIRKTLRVALTRSASRTKKLRVSTPRSSAQSVVDHVS
jgi:hypothetical protein